MHKKWIFLAVPLASLVLFAMPAGAAQPPANQDVTVTNDAAHAIPTVAQGTTNVAGTVNVGNLPATQAVSGTVNVGNLPAIQNVQITPAHPVTLQAAPGLNGQPITHQRYLLGRTSGGGSDLSGQLAIGSITVAVVGAGSSEGSVDVSVLATDCGSQGYGEIAEAVVRTDSTQHLDFPTPTVTPAGGARQQFCIAAEVTNGQDAAIVYITVVGNTL